MLIIIIIINLTNMTTFAVLVRILILHIVSMTPVPCYSPFTVAVQPGSPADRVRVTGDGIQPTVLASMPVQFIIDTRDAGVPAETDVVIQVGGLDFLS